MRRLFSTDIAADRVTLDTEQARHARKALRLKPGDAVELFDGRGQIATGTLLLDGRSTAVAIESRRQEPRPVPCVRLAVAMPKGSRADLLVEKASELGVDRLIPLLTDRSVVDPGAGKQHRLERIAIESGKQSGRARLMEIAPPTPLGELLHDNGEPRADGRRLKLIADPSGLGAISPDLLLRLLNTARQVTVLIGPEGGWTDDERRQARDARFVPWRLGPHILRVETAALAAATLCRQVI